MALFSGGRYIRSKLQAGLQASIASSSPSIQHGPRSGLAFWNFPGEVDGEDLKLEYKNRVTALTTELTEEEKADIVAESVSIMTHLIDIVSEVAEVVPSRAVALALQAPPEESIKFQVPVARTVPPWSLLVRSLFPLPFRDVLSAAVALIAARGPEQEIAKPLPVQVNAE